jgi:hypothetical protein
VLLVLYKPGRVGYISPVPVLLPVWAKYFPMLEQSVPIAVTAAALLVAAPKPATSAAGSTTPPIGRDPRRVRVWRAVRTRRGMQVPVQVP